MNDVNTEMLQTACEFWELGLIEILFINKILTAEEYNGIYKIIREDYKVKNCV